MRIIEETYSKAKYQIKIGTTWRTIALLQSNLFSFLKGTPKYEIYFLEYGEEHSKWFGNDAIGLYSNDYMTMTDAIEKATPIIQKKLYKLADGILSDLQMEEDHESEDKVSGEV